MQCTYTYDLSGNRLSKVHDVNGDGITTSDDLASTFYYGTPDANGNVAQQDGDNRLIEEKDVTGGASPVITFTAFTYDSNGFQTQKQIKDAGGNVIETDSYTPDLRGRMKSAAVAGQTTTFTYDTQGTIIQEVTGGTTIQTLPDANNPSGYVYPLEQATTQQGVTTRQTFAVGATGVAMQVDTNGTVTLLIADGQGSTRQIIGTNRAVKAYYAFDAFGNLLTSLGSVTTPFLYTGQEWDAGVGEYNLRSRFYQPMLGRFGQQDSYLPAAGDVENADLYVYVSGDPVNADDPTGKSLGEFLAEKAGCGVNALLFTVCKM